MSSQTNERAFESTVQSMFMAGGWRPGDLAEWNVERALFPARAVAFMQESQPESWDAMASLHGDNLERLIVDALVRELDLKGTLDVLRHGFKFYGQTFRLAWFKPAHGLNPEALARFERNELTVTRQVPCHPGSGATVDLVFALNGLPVATCELKNPMTGQTWRSAVRQYQLDRDPSAPIFRFQKRALVHFAADPDEIHMTTRLAGGQTRFLPFNRGSRPGDIRCGAGNPPHPSGYRTGYFWQDVLGRERFLDILGSYMFVERRDEKVQDAKGARTVKRETLIFPRYHQLDAVGRLVAAAAADGPGRNYLTPALRGQRQDEQHLVALAPAGEPARHRRREGLSLRRRDHRPPRARPAAPGRRLPDRTRPGRCEGDRPGFKATGERPGGWDDDRHHHAAEIPFRHGRLAARRRR